MCASDSRSVGPVSRPKKRKGGRVTPKGTGSTSRPPGGLRPGGPNPLGRGPMGPLDGPWLDQFDDDGDVDGEVGDGDTDVLARAGDAITTGHPAELLVLASTFAEAVADAARTDPLIPGSTDDELYSWRTVVDELTGSTRPETTALLHALRPFVPDEWNQVITAELSERHTPSLPAWISSIGEAEVTSVWCRSHDLGHDDDVFIGARWPTGQVLTLVVHVDHELGGSVQDVILMPADIDQVLRVFAAPADGPTSLTEVDLADARAQIAAAVDRWEQSSPRTLTDDWPSARPLLLWLLSRLPLGGPDASASGDSRT